MLAKHDDLERPWQGDFVFLVVFLVAVFALEPVDLRTLVALVLALVDFFEVVLAVDFLAVVAGLALALVESFLAAAGMTARMIATVMAITLVNTRAVMKRLDLITCSGLPYGLAA